MSEKIEFEKDERIVAKVRKHWIIFARDISGTVLIGIILPAIALALLSLLPIPAASPALVYFVTSLWLLIVWLAIAVIWTNYYLDLWIVTNKRILNIEQIGLFDRKVATWRMERVQEITVEMRNVFQTLLNYGTVHIQTAGPTDEYAVIEGIPHPEHVRALMLKEVDRTSSFRNNAGTSSL